MNTRVTVDGYFREAADAIAAAAEPLCAGIESAASLMIECIEAGGKIMICGNGGSAADAQHLSSELLNRYHRDRRELPGLALTTDASTLTSIGNDFDFERIFSKQILGLGRPEDILIVITTSGNSSNLLRAVEAAHTLSLPCIALNGRDGGRLNAALNENDVNILAPGELTAHIQEIHGVVIHCLCELIDQHLLDSSATDEG